jgi:predicted SprT family Zn-dependent metalloprotease
MTCSIPAKDRWAMHDDVQCRGANAAEKIGVPLPFRAPQIIDKDMRSSHGGEYHPDTHAVWMNTLLNCTAEDYLQTLIHEVAHAVVAEAIRHHQAQGKRLRAHDWSSHGPWWAQVMRHMGTRPDRCHNLDVASAMPDKYASQTCACGFRHQMTRRRVDSAKKRGAKFFCKCSRPIDNEGWKDLP